jgi:hypothetical protein
MRLFIYCLFYIFIVSSSCITDVDMAKNKPKANKSQPQGARFDCKPDSSVLVEYSKNLTTLEKYILSDEFLLSEKKKSFIIISKIKLVPIV